MKSVSRENPNFNQNILLIDHNIIDFNFYSDSHFHSKYKLDENEKKLLDFMNSKLEAMEKINLDDECLVKDENEKRKINNCKNLLPKSKYQKNKEGINSMNKIKNKNNSKKNSKRKSNDKNIVINHKVEKTEIKSIDFIDVINFNVDKEIKEKDLDNFFSSNRALLISIINEMKDK